MVLYYCMLYTIYTHFCMCASVRAVWSWLGSWRKPWSLEQVLSLFPLPWSCTGLSSYQTSQHISSLWRTRSTARVVWSSTSRYCGDQSSIIAAYKLLLEWDQDGMHITIVKTVLEVGSYSVVPCIIISSSSNFDGCMRIVCSLLDKNLAIARTFLVRVIMTQWFFLVDRIGEHEV